VSKPIRVLRSFARPPSLAVVLLMVLLPSCSDSPSFLWGPVEIRVTLVSPNGVEGAAVFDVSGADLREVRLVEGEEGRLFEEQAGAATMVAVIRATPGTLRFVIEVDDPRRVTGVRVVQVADGDDRIRPALDGYLVQLEGAPR